jgi:hypothetical protein
MIKGCGVVAERELAGETEVFGKFLALCHLSATNPTLPGLGSTSDCRGEKPATNRLSYDTTYHVVLKH